MIIVKTINYIQNSILLDIRNHNTVIIFKQLKICTILVRKLKNICP
jgi:hypothetical protein